MEENHSSLKTLVGSPCVCEGLCSCAHKGNTKDLSVISKVPISLVDTCLFRSSILSYWVLFICSLQESSPCLPCCPVNDPFKGCRSYGHLGSCRTLKYLLSLSCRSSCRFSNFVDLFWRSFCPLISSIVFLFFNIIDSCSLWLLTLYVSVLLVS